MKNALKNTENTEKYKTFSVTIRKEVRRIYKHGKNYKNHTLLIETY